MTIYTMLCMRCEIQSCDGMIFEIKNRMHLKTLDTLKRGGKNDELRLFHLMHALSSHNQVGFGSLDLFYAPS